MRFRLLRRRLTISAPTMAVRSHLPWPLKWAVAALVLGFCAAISLWAFEFGKDIAGLEKHAKEDLVRLKEEVAQLKEQRDKAQTLASSSETLMAAEHAAQQALLSQIKSLEAENRQLRDDLGFFEKLLPTDSGSDGLSIRGLSAQLSPPSQLKWQFLLIHAAKNAPVFHGKFELNFVGIQQGKPWSLTTDAQTLEFKQLSRLQGTQDLPAQVQVKSLTLKIYEGSAQRAVQTIKL